MYDEKSFPAKTALLEQVQDFVRSHLPEDCPIGPLMQLDLVVEEIFVNIADYAYAPGEGTVTIRVERSDSPAVVTVSFLDRGVAFDPLAKEQPDVSALAEDRQIGGLGIYLTRRLADEVRYERRDGQNILTIRKKL